ncbi:MAG: sialidase family protein [Acidimicrobiales bacterium]
MATKWVVGRGVIVAAVVGGLAVASAGMARAAPSPQATFAAQGAKILRLTAAVQMTKDPAPARAFSGPASMLADPSDPHVIVAATTELRSRICYLTRSTDAGRTWHILAAVPALASYQYCTNGNAGVAVASIAWGSNATLYYALEGYGNGEGGRAGHASILLARSTDLGDSWSTTVVDDNRGRTDDPPTDTGVQSLAVDTSGPRDVVYVGFTRSFPMAAKGSPEQSGAVAVAVSADGGRSFGAPVNLDDFSHVTQTIAGQSYPLLMQAFFGAPFLVAHDGVVVATASSQVPSGVKLPGTSYFAMPQLVARSTDRGRTWTVTTLGPPIFTGTGAQTGLGWTPEGGPHGTFLATYAATPQDAASSGAASVVLQRSTDAGLTWTDPVVLNDDDPTQQFSSFYPQLGVAPDGRADVVWEDTRNQVDYHVGVYYTYSTDGGLTWAHNVEVSDRPVDFGLGVSFNSDIRQPPGVASANQYAAVGWADTRLGNVTTQNQDDFGAVAQFSPVPTSTSEVAPILAAAFGGLAAAGAVLLVVLAIGRRRDRVAPAAGTGVATEVEMGVE